MRAIATLVTRQRKWAELGRELTDEEAAAEELAGDDVLALTAESWGWLVANEATTDLLDAAELGGPVAAMAWLDDRHLAWDLATTAPSLPPTTPEVRERARWRPTLWQLPQIRRRAIA